MTHSMIERVARAIYDKHVHYPANAEEWPFETLPKTAMPWVLARAALEAMKEPTEAMCEFAEDNFDRNGDHIAVAWRCFIDAALSEKIR